MDTKPSSARGRRRSPSLAALLSFLWPGLGQLYAGKRRAAPRRDVLRRLDGPGLVGPCLSIAAGARGVRRIAAAGPGAKSDRRLA
jgi:hypothetical protein